MADHTPYNTRMENSTMSENPLGKGTRKRTFEYVRGANRATTLTITDPFTGQKTVQNGTTATGLYGREMTSSERGSNWLSYKSLQSSAGMNAPNMRWLSTMDLGTAPFLSVKHIQEFSHERDLDVDLNVQEGNYRYQYRGPWVAKDANVGSTSSLYPPVPGDLDAAMLRNGATAIARTIPTNPVAGAAQFLGELKEGLPSIPGKSAIRRGGPGGLADEYINYEFALKPIISDLRKFGEAARSADKVIAQLKRDSGRLIRRRYTFPVERTTTRTVESTQAYGSPGFRLIGPNCYTGGPGQLTRVREETRKFWFSGAYTYLYPEGDSALDRMRQAESRMNRLFGTRVSPELFWELTPWSWAADWVSNAGDVIHNISAFSSDGLVLRWGYIMCHYTCRDTYSLTGVGLKGATGGPRSQTFVTDVKKRLRATPYGFGLDLSSFTTRQWAILGALGISRAQGML